MSILNKLPLFGKGDFEPSFHVQFKNGSEGLEGIVDLAIHGRAGEYMLGECEASPPLSCVNVRLTVNSNGTYTLLARLEKAVDGKLGVDLKPIKAAGFAVVTGGEQTTLGDVFLQGKPTCGVMHLRSPQLPKEMPIAISTISSDAVEVKYNLNPNGLTLREVEKTISTFAKALELVANSILKGGGRASQPKTLYLAPGGQVTRLKIEKPNEYDSGRWSDMLNEAKQKEQNGHPAATTHNLEETVTLQDIGGLSKDTRDRIELILLACRNPGLLADYGAQPLKGVLLYGNPGTGKTLIGKAIAHEAGINFYYLRLTDINTKWHGESERNLADYLEGIKSQGRGVLFIDEMEELAPKREGVHEVTGRLVNLLNKYMDGLDSMGGIIVMGATNMRESIDKATMSRFNYEINVPLPDKTGREEILGILLRKASQRTGRSLFDNLEPARIAEITQDYSGRDLANLVDRTCIGRLTAETLHNEPVRKITTQDFMNEKPNYDAEKTLLEKGVLGFRR